MGQVNGKELDTRVHLSLCRGLHHLLLGESSRFLRLSTSFRLGPRRYLGFQRSHSRDLLGLARLLRLGRFRGRPRCVQLRIGLRPDSCRLLLRSAKYLGCLRCRCFFRGPHHRCGLDRVQLGF